MEQIPHWVSDAELVRLASMSDDPLLSRIARLLEPLQQQVRDLEEALDEAATNAPGL